MLGDWLRYTIKLVAERKYGLSGVDVGRQMRVLIVDDHEVVRKGVRSLLLRSGYDVCGEGVDGEDGLAKAKELKPDVIVMDVTMPRLNGLEATRQMRGILPDIQVVILSQHESAEMV